MTTYYDEDQINSYRERPLVGAGVNYDPLYEYNDHYRLPLKYADYYKFKSYDSYLLYGNYSFGNGSWLAPYTNEVWYGAIYPTVNGYIAEYTTLTNKLFTGILPYQDPFDNFYYNILADRKLDNIYFEFGLPVCITKYRIWNGFTNGVSGPTSSNMGLDTPRSWTLWGTNDFINWSVVDSRSNQEPLPYATSKLCRQSPYSEYVIGNRDPVHNSPPAYKTYRLTIDLGPSNSEFCTSYNKSGCQSHYRPWHIGEIQLWGYENPTAPCSLHGYDTLFPKARPDASMVKLFGLNRACKEPGAVEGGVGMGIDPNSWSYPGEFSYPYVARLPDRNTLQMPIYRTRRWRSDNFQRYTRNPDGSYVRNPDGSIKGSEDNDVIDPHPIAISGSINFGTDVILTSYKMLSTGFDGEGLEDTPGGWTGYGRFNYTPTCWTLYGGSNSVIDSRRDESVGYLSYSNFAIQSPSSYSSYKLELWGGDFLRCDDYENFREGDCYWKNVEIADLQLLGIVPPF
jgi:hypothetical protein